MSQALNDSIGYRATSDVMALLGLLVLLAYGFFGKGFSRMWKPVAQETDDEEMEDKLMSS